MNLRQIAPVKEVPHLLIPLSDGRRLAARLWLPDGPEQSPVPAILEYLPYRKRDGTAQRDESTYPIFAANGYAGIRVDIAGTGESDGGFDDEYSARELTDGVEVIAWIAQQVWCDGNVGMMGISWGGFNSLQIASMKPPALRAVIAIGTTVDRYNDDIHYKNGCLLYSNAGWSAVMLCFASKPPDPLLVGDSWREMWLERLQTQPFPLETWLAHQHRDDYWRRGSVCEDYDAMNIPALVISGWADGYINAPPAAIEHFTGVTKAINGPWIHQYPHLAYPHPRIDFHREALNWWDAWLKGVDNGVTSLPAYRAYISQSVHPGVPRVRENGRWVAEPIWPSAEIVLCPYYPSKNSELDGVPPANDAVTLCSPLDCGTAAGEFFPLKPDVELSLDQAADDAGSAVFDSPPLKHSVEILGRPIMRLRVTIDQPLGNLAIRLVDVHPDGACFRVSWGVINLAHRHGNETPEPVTPGVPIDVVVRLDECGYHFAVGHRIRLSISTAYWPMVMPCPYLVTAQIHTGKCTAAQLPVRQGGDVYELTAPENLNPLPQYPLHRPAHYERSVTRDRSTGQTQLQVIDDTGEEEMPGHGLRVRHRREDQWSIIANEPLSARSITRYTCWMSRGDWSIRTETDTTLRCDTGHFYLFATVKAFENETLVSERQWQKTLTRDLL